MISADSMKSLLDEFLRRVDLAGFSRASALAVLGFRRSSQLMKIQHAGRQVVIVVKMRILISALTTELSTGNYPACVDHDHEIEQLEQLYNKYKQ